MADVTKNKTLKKQPTIVLIGRANVGKSTLFNKIIDHNKALVSDVAGTTRDINSGLAYWRGVNFKVLDTGGIETIVSTRKLKKMSPKENEDFALEILQKSQGALKSADVILFLVDGSVGILPADRVLAKNLFKYNKKIFLVANKLDSMKEMTKSEVFQALGVDDIRATSSASGIGIGDLLDDITDYLQDKDLGEKEDIHEVHPGIKVALLGRPNVGKSSLFNKLIGEDKVIVSDVPHTTREPNDMSFEYDGKTITIIDTAGIRKKAKVEKGLEKASVSKTIGSVKRADVILFVVDVSQRISTQDKHLAEILTESDAGIIVVANKWDLVSNKHTNIQKEITKDLHKSFPFLTWTPIVFVSAKTGQHVHKIFQTIFKVHNNRNIIIPQEQLETFIIKATKKHKPIAEKGIRRPTILDFEQVRTNPPVFQMRIRSKDNIATTYLRYLENQIRKEFDIEGIRVWITVKK